MLKIFLLLALLGLLAVLLAVGFVRRKLRGFGTEVATAMAVASQPPTIELVRDRGVTWQDPDAVAGRVQALRALGFRTITTCRIEELPAFRLVALAHPEEGFGAVVYEHQESDQIWCDLVVAYQGGDLLTVSDVGSKLPQPPFAEKVHLKGASAAKLYRTLKKRLRPDPHRPIHPGNFKDVFEESWKREQAWREEQQSGDDGGEPVDLMADLPPADAAQAARLRIDAESWRFLGAAVQGLKVLTLTAHAPRGAANSASFPGDIEPDPEDEECEILKLEALAALVPERRAPDLVKKLQNSLANRGVQCLITGRGPKDFVYMFQTGLMPASRFCRGKVLVVFFKYLLPDPLLWVRQTNAANYDLDTGGILSKLDEWRQLCQLRVVGAGWDWVQLELETLPEDLHAFARDAVDFCYDLIPELVNEDELEDEEDDEDEERDTYAEAGAAALVERLGKNRTLVLWWD